MSGRSERLKTAILAVLPLVVVTSVVCPACSAVALGVEFAPSCARPSSAGAERAGAEEPAQGCHSAAPLAVRSQGAGGSCCLVETPERPDRPDAVASAAAAWTVAPLPTPGIEVERQSPLYRSESSSFRPLGVPLYRLHRALLI